MKSKLFKLFAIVFAAVAFSAQAQQAEQPKPQTPTALKGGQIINAKAAKQLADTKGAMFFDMRSAINYGKGHLPDAKALPYRENSDFTVDFDAGKDQFDIKALPTDKSAKIVFYSDGPQGWKSYKASVLAIKDGYTNVHYFRGGTDEWSKARFAFQK